MRFLLAISVFAVLIGGCSGREAVAPAEEMNATLESPQELAAAADVPLYPDATLPDGESNIKRVDKQVRYEIVMTTDDPVLEVEAFYTKELKVSKIPDTESLMGYSPKGNFLKIDMVREAGVTRITAVSVQEEKAGG